VNHLSSTLGVLSIGDLETLKDSAVVSLGGTLAIFAAVLLILLHNPMAAALALVPIFLGCIVPVGIGSWLGYPVSPIHLLSLPFVLGVNAYLTINLLGAFFHHLQNGRDRMAAAAEAFGDFAPLMCHVYLILGAGIGVLGFSKFGMVREFGLTTLSFLATSFAVNLVGIPCLSAGWLGICFDHQKRKSNRQSGLEMVLEETLPRETAAEPNLKHSGNRPSPRTNSQRRIDGGPKKIA
jgi:predicted RND superfamily exporter protein